MTDDATLIICRCREISEEEIRQAVRDGATTLSGVKRRTHAGMGLCQGKSCSRLVARIIAEERGIRVSELAPPSARPPVRPLSLKVISEGSCPSCDGEAPINEDGQAPPGTDGEKSLGKGGA